MRAQWQASDSKSDKLPIDFVGFFFLEVFALWLPRAVANRTRGRDWSRISEGSRATRNAKIFLPIFIL